MGIALKQFIKTWCYTHRSVHHSVLKREPSSCHRWKLMQPQLASMQIIKDCGVFSLKQESISHPSPRGTGNFMEEEIEMF